MSDASSKHPLTPPWLAAWRLNAVLSAEIGAVLGAETFQRGELRFVVEGPMPAAFKAGDCRRGALAAIHQAGALLTEHFPVWNKNPNEPSNQPMIY